MGNLTGRDWVVVVLVATLIGGVVGFVTGKTVAKDAVLEALRQEGVEAHTFHLVDEEGVSRLSLWVPTAAQANLVGMPTPYPFVRVHEVDGSPAADVPITPSLVRRAGGM